MYTMIKAAFYQPFFADTVDNCQIAEQHLKRKLDLCKISEEIVRCTERISLVKNWMSFNALSH